jgi:hypothetical protein
MLECSFHIVHARDSYICKRQRSFESASSAILVHDLDFRDSKRSNETACTAFA